MRDEFGAFVTGPPCALQPTAPGLLSGLSFAAKDLFDIAGHVTGSGNPDWARTHPPARRHAAAVEVLLGAGAVLAGKTVTDEISLGLLGRNRFDGTPLNPRAPRRVPGGSSSGSASAVAGGLVDLALGTDSGGSVRTPASFCGLYGIRPTHGRVSVEGMATQSPSFDTCGWFARDAETFAKAGEALLGAPAEGAPFRRLVIAEDCFALADSEVQTALAGPVEALGRHFRTSESKPLAEGSILEWSAAQRPLQAAEFHATFRPWIERCVPRFSIEVGRSLSLAAMIEESALVEPRAFRLAAKARMASLIGGDAVLCLPTSPILPPFRDEPFSAMTRAVDRIIELTAIAGLTGSPQISIPMAADQGVPVGLSLIGPAGSDERLLALARGLAEPG
ncbi:MAG: amidase [Pikeienuella sp.]|uniref:amidase n=1 Tax=Pikeienuella sp. TaxID=2831957 RepID=UPI003919EF1E